MHKESVILKTGSLWYKQVQQNQDVPVHCTELSFALCFTSLICAFLVNQGARGILSSFQCYRSVPRHTKQAVHLPSLAAFLTVGGEPEGAPQDHLGLMKSLVLKGSAAELRKQKSWNQSRCNAVGTKIILTSSMVNQWRAEKNICTSLTFCG